MPLDPNIILGARPPQIDFAQLSPMNAMTNVMKFRQADQESQLNALKMAEYERTRTEEDDVRNYLKAANLSTPEGRTGLNQFGKTGLAYSKALSEQDTAALTQKETQFKVQKARKDFVAQAQRDTSQNPSDANITAYKEDLMANPMFNDAEKAQMAAAADRILAMPVSERKTFMSSQGASASELKPTLTSQGLGGSTRIMSTPAFGGTATVVPGSAANISLSPEGRATDARERERIANAENPNAVSKQVVGEDGTVTNFNKFGQVVSTVKGAGKQSATYAKTEAQKKTLGNDLSVAISELGEITKDGGLIDQSTGSYIGKGVDIGYRAFGKATTGDIAAGKLAPIADLVLKMVPRFEGPQSDKDTASYKQAAGQLSDSGLPTEIRKEAGKEILRLMKNRKNQFITSDMASGNTATPSGVAPPEGFVPD
jgi:hypothetical protein